MVSPSLALALSLAQTERVINHALQYSLEWPDYAARLNNTTLHCELLPLGKSIYIQFHDNVLSISSHGPEQVDLHISATPSALLEMMQHKRAGSNIHIAGNAHLAQTLQQAMSALNIDWEAILADKMGDIPARQAYTIFGKLTGFASRFAKTFISDTADYLVDEKQLLPSKIEADAFYKKVTTLRYDADRLEARIRRLEGNEYVQ